MHAAFRKYREYLDRNTVPYSVSRECIRDPDHTGPLPANTPNPRRHDGPGFGVGITEYYSVKHQIGSTHATLSTARVMMDPSFFLEGKSFVEIGCGTGMLSIMAAMSGARVVSTDIDGRAVRLTQKNALANGVHLDVRRGSFCEPLSNGEVFDWCACNLPQKPGMPGHDLPISQAGGRDGDRVWRRVLSGIARRQQKGAKILFFMHSLPHCRLLQAISEYYRLECRLWKLRWFTENEYGALHHLFRARHKAGSSFLWVRGPKEAMVCCIWLGTRR